jgi:proteic killer suppression protein
VIRSFRDRGTADVYYGRDSNFGRRACPLVLWRVAQRKLEWLNSAVELRDLVASKGNRLEALAGERVGQYSIRINRQYRICFEWTPKGPVAVEITDYH